MGDLVLFLIVALVVLFVLVLFFNLLERFLKGSSKKATEKPVAPKPSPAKDVEPSETPVLKIYNSELADDLQEILKQSNNNETARLQVESHISKEGNIAKYIKSKNYSGFNFDNDDETDASDDEDGDKGLSFTKEDYKRIMALSNIDDKKSL